MRNPMYSISYQIEEVPDPTDPGLRQRASESVETEIERRVEGFLTVLSEFPPDSAWASILFDYKPDPKPEGQQRRLSLYATVGGRDSATKSRLGLALCGGFLEDFYRLKRDQPLPLRSEDLKACYTVLVREETRISPFGPELNAKILSQYYLRHAPQADRSNTYELLDRVLNKTDEHVQIILAVRSVDVSAERRALAAYAAKVDEINHSRGGERREDSQSFDYFFGESGERGERPSYLELPRRRDPIADLAARNIQKFREGLEAPQLFFQFQVWAESAEVAHHVGSVAAECAFLEGSYRLEGLAQGDESFERLRKETEGVVLWPVPSAGVQARQSEPRVYAEFDRLAQLAGVSELVGMFRLPIGGYWSPRTIRQHTDPPVLRAEEMVFIGHEVGRGMRGSEPIIRVPRGIPADYLNRHLGVFGKTGCGKTWLLSLIVISCVRLRIPLIFYAPIRGEHAHLKMAVGEEDPHLAEAAEKIRVYTPGRDGISPFRFNPLKPLPGISIEEHMERILEATFASVPVFPALQASLQEGLYKLYKRFPDPGRPPVFADWIAEADKAFRSYSYEGDLKGNLATAMNVRERPFLFGPVARILDSRESIPGFEDLLSGYTIVEFEGLSRESTSLLIHLHLNAVWQHLARTRAEREGIRLVIIIDECHVVSTRESQPVQREESVNLTAQASQVLNRLVREVRKYKGCVVLADQSAQSLDADLIRLIGSFAAMWTTDRFDRETLGNSMNMRASEVDELVLLEKGEAFLATQGYIRPRKIRTPSPPVFMRETQPPSDEELRAALEKEAWFQSDRRARIRADLDLLESRMDAFDRARLRLAERLIEIRRRQIRLLEDRSPGGAKVERMLRDLYTLREEFLKLYEDFKDRSYHRLLPDLDESLPKEIRGLAQDRRNHFEKGSQPETSDLLDRLANAIGDMRKQLEA